MDDEIVDYYLAWRNRFSFLFLILPCSELRTSSIRGLMGRIL